MAAPTAGTHKCLSTRMTTGVTQLTGTGGEHHHVNISVRVQTVDTIATTNDTENPAVEMSTASGVATVVRCQLCKNSNEATGMARD